MSSMSKVAIEIFTSMPSLREDYGRLRKNGEFVLERE
jgi:hypothetical protein